MNGSFMQNNYDINLQRRVQEIISSFYGAYYSNDKSYIIRLIQSGLNLNNVPYALVLACRKKWKDVAGMLLQRNCLVGGCDRYGSTELIMACRNGWNDIANMLLERGCEVNAQNKKGKSALMYACKNGDFNTAKVLIELGAKVNLEDKYGRTSLFYFLDSENMDILNLLLQNGADVEKKNIRGDTMFIYVCETKELRNKYEILTALMDAGCDINARNKCGETGIMFLVDENIEMIRKLIQRGADINVRDNDGNSVLMNFCKYVDNDVLDDVVDKVRLLIDKGCNVNDRNKKGKTVLMVAFEVGLGDLLNNLLIEAGCDINASDDDGKTVLMEAGGEANVRELIRRRVNVDASDKNGRTALMIACEYGELPIVRLLIDAGCDMNKKDENENTALMIACKNLQREIAMLLIENSCDINAGNKDGQTAIMFACESGMEDVVNKLIDAGCDINKKDDRGCNLLRYACKGKLNNMVRRLIAEGQDVDNIDIDGCTNISEVSKLGHDTSSDGELTGNDIISIVGMVDMLVNNGANIYVVDNFGRTALMEACDAGNEFLAEKLLSLGVDVKDINAVDNNGKTALMCACYNGISVVETLIKSGANINAVDNDGKTALMYAMAGMRWSVIEILLHHGANINVVNENGRTILEELCKYEKYNSLDEVNLLILKLIHSANLRNDYFCYWALKYYMDKRFYVAATVIASETFEQERMFRVACKNGMIDIVRELIRGGYDVNRKDKYGHTPISSMFTSIDILSQDNIEDMVMMLVENGADINIPNDNGETPLILACKLYLSQERKVYENEIERIVVKLIDSGANVNAIDNNGRTALMYTCEYGITRVAIRLIESGADVNVVDNDGRTAFEELKDEKEYAVDRNYLFDRFIKEGVYIYNKYVCTLALINENFSVVNKLVDRGLFIYEDVVKVLEKKKLDIFVKMIIQGEIHSNKSLEDDSIIKRMFGDDKVYKDDLCSALEKTLNAIYRFVEQDIDSIMGKNDYKKFELAAKSFCRFSYMLEVIEGNNIPRGLNELVVQYKDFLNMKSAIIVNTSRNMNKLKHNIDRVYDMSYKKARTK